VLARETYLEKTRGNPNGIRGIYWRPFGNWSVGDSISRFPRILWPILCFLRNVQLYWRPRFLPFHYFADGIASKLPMSFRNDPDFDRCYERMIRAAGTATDPGLHFRIHQAIWAGKTAFPLEGDFVECGTGRGMVMSAVLESLAEWNDASKTLWLFDTFSPYSLDPVTGKNDVRRGSRWNYAISTKETAQNFRQWNRVQLVEGYIPDSLSTVDIQAISFLHIDLNHPTAERSALEVLWPKLVFGGVLLLDDYGQSVSQQKAVDQFLGDCGQSILTTGSGQGIVVRR
jgi:O-methyltransferase